MNLGPDLRRLRVGIASDERKQNRQANVHDESLQRQECGNKRTVFRRAESDALTVVKSMRG